MQSRFKFPKEAVDLFAKNHKDIEKAAVDTRLLILGMITLLLTALFLRWA